MRQLPLWNAVSMFPARSAEGSLVEEELIKNNIGLRTFPTRLFKGQIDLLDPMYEKDGKLPYVRFMEILREQNMRKQLERLMKSEYWAKASAGTPTYPGGQREVLVKQIKDRAEQQALHQMLSEWKDTPLADRYASAKYELPRAAKYGGPDAEAVLREKTGLAAPKH